jgi:hypothetical protein
LEEIFGMLNFAGDLRMFTSVICPKSTPS